MRAQVRRHVVQLVITHGEVWLDAAYPCKNLVCILLALLDRLRIFVLLASQVVALLRRALRNIKVLWRQVGLPQRVHQLHSFGFGLGIVRATPVLEIVSVLRKPVKVVARSNREVTLC